MLLTLAFLVLNQHKCTITISSSYFSLYFSHDTVNINLKKKPEWFLEKTPFGLVPVIEYDGHIIYESAICDDWLDDVFPEPHLTATSPYKKAEDRIVMAHFDRVNFTKKLFCSLIY